MEIIAPYIELIVVYNSTTHFCVQMIFYWSYKIIWIKIFFRHFSLTFSKKFLISLTFTYHLTNSLTFPDFPDRVETLKIKYCLKEATVLYFTRYSCVVFILFNTGLYKSAFSIDSFGKLVFAFLCFLCFASSVSNLM